MARPVQDAPRPHENLRDELLAHYRAQAECGDRFLAEQGRRLLASLEQTIARGGRVLLLNRPGFSGDSVP